MQVAMRHRCLVRIRRKAACQFRCQMQNCVTTSNLKREAAAHDATAVKPVEEMKLPQLQNLHLRMRDVRAWERGLRMKTWHRMRAEMGFFF